MSFNIEVVHNSRRLEIKASMIAGDWQLWIYDAGTRVYLYGIVPYDRSHEIDGALRQARIDVETDAIIVPVVRSWPRPTAGSNEQY